MKEGFWVNYDTGAVHEVNEHERDIRIPAVAKELGVPQAVFRRFREFVPVRDRVAFLVWLMRRVPLMRVRGHGGLYNTVEFASASERQPWKAIRKMAAEFPPTKLLNVVNLATGRGVQVLAMDLGRGRRRR